MRAPPIEAVGRRGLRVIQQLGALALFVVSIARAAVARPYRFGRLVAEVFDVGVLSLGIICASGAVIGAVLALQGYYMLVRFGAEDALGTMVGLTLVLELGPVLTALLTTGRAASAMAAGIASMVTTEQLDGLRMMSIDPIDFVVAPKAIAMVLVMPMLSGLFIVCGILGGYLVGVELLGLDGGNYFSSLEESIDFADDVAQSLLKALVFGALAGIIATYRGYTSEPTAAGVSAATTGTVVVTSVSVLIANYVITALWRAYGPPGGY